MILTPFHFRPLSTSPLEYVPLTLSDRISGQVNLAFSGWYEAINYYEGQILIGHRLVLYLGGKGDRALSGGLDGSSWNWTELGGRQSWSVSSRYLEEGRVAVLMSVVNGSWFGHIYILAKQ